MKISLAIPYHDTPNTAFYLSRLLGSLSQQNFKDYEVVLAKDGNFARNHNSTIHRSKGEFVQMLGMDDYFPDPDALGRIVAGLETGAIWQISACVHDINGAISNPHIPQWTDNIYTGNNRLGSVSTLSFRRENALFFEEPLTWLVDVDLYYRLFLKYGEPFINKNFNLVINGNEHRLTHTLSSQIKEEEVQYLHKKYVNSKN